MGKILWKECGETPHWWGAELDLCGHASAYNRRQASSVKKRSFSSIDGQPRSAPVGAGRGFLMWHRWTRYVGTYATDQYKNSRPQLLWPALSLVQLIGNARLTENVSYLAKALEDSRFCLL